MTRRGVTKAFLWRAGAWLRHGDAVASRCCRCCVARPLHRCNLITITKRNKSCGGMQLVWLARQLANLPSCQVPTVTELELEMETETETATPTATATATEAPVEYERDEQQVKPPRDLFMQSDKI